mgnify:CR=1 FL=1
MLHAGCELVGDEDSERLLVDGPGLARTARAAGRDVPVPGPLRELAQHLQAAGGQVGDDKDGGGGLVSALTAAPPKKDDISAASAGGDGDGERHRGG